MVSEQLLVLPVTYYEAPVLPEKTVLSFDPTQEAQERKWDQVGIKLAIARSAVRLGHKGMVWEGLIFVSMLLYISYPLI